ncbi:nuclear transport factor 2 family protein [Flavobacterium marginilacus]|uniref:nuclear transport factor 2 family protein n=1 Tax=Flavobacterium marginilacus TaxID=3003256 RepID=UPI00248EB466|nr:hypothetical protein [Flavobacterium marginilacus]
MKTSENTLWKYSDEQQQLAKQIIDLEMTALDKWFNGDSSGYRDLWSKTNFSYFDGVFDHRIDTHEEISKFVTSVVDGKLYAKSYDFTNPRVQFGQDIAILTFQLHADTSLIDMHYNCIEIYQKEGDSWSVIHSTWSFIRPMDMDFNAIKEVV